MKRKFLVFVTAALLVLAGSAAWAQPAIPTINLYDLGEGAPLVSTFNFSYSNINPVVIKADEFATVTGSLFSNYITAGTYGIKMLEPAREGGGVSDFATLVVSPVLPFIGQPFNLTFLSDGAVGFDLALCLFNEAFPNARCLVEDGTLQNLFSFSGLVVNAQSDVAPVPIPAALLLFGTGLVALGAYARKKH